MAVRVILDSVSAVAALDRLIATNGSCEAQLPSGRVVLISPIAEIRAVAAALADPEFRASIQQSAAEYSAGQIALFDPRAQAGASSTRF